jgi:hypothetical protein
MFACEKKKQGQNFWHWKKMEKGIGGSTYISYHKTLETKVCPQAI